MIVWILVIVFALVLCWSREYFKNRPSYGLYRYGYPYSYYGTWYRPQGYWGPGYFGDPHGYGSFGYGGKQQDLSCRLGCLRKYREHCKEKSLEECQEKLTDCLDLCEAHSPYYNYDESY